MTTEVERLVQVVEDNGGEMDYEELRAQMREPLDANGMKALRRALQFRLETRPEGGYRHYVQVPGGND